MNTFGTCLRTSLLALLTLTLVGGGIFTDYYFRHEITRKAQRLLADRQIPVAVESAVEFAGKGDNETLRLLSYTKVELGGHVPSGETPLIAAMKAGQEETIEYLLAREDVIDTIRQSTNPERETAVGLALHRRDFGMVDRLIGLGATVDVEKFPGVPFLVDAIKSRDVEMIDFLLSRNADVAYQGAQPHAPVAVAASNHDLELISRLSDAGADLDVLGLSGNPILIEAVNDHAYDRIKLLIEKGADVNIRTSETSGAGLTPLHLAISKEDGWIQEMLLDAGADPNSADRNGNSLLYQAVEDQDYDLVHQLIDHGADPDAQGATGETVLSCAIGQEDLHMVELLLENGADPNYAPEKQEAPLLKAVGNGNIAISRHLIEEGADFDGSGMLARAFDKRDDPLLNLLLNSGANPESTFPETRLRVFDAAVEQGATSAVRSLLGAGATIGDNLWAALLTGQDDLVALILDGGANPRQKGPDGQDPLDFCLSNERYRAARLLLDAGADPNARYSSEQSWLDKAILEGNEPLADALLDYGAKPLGEGRASDGHTLLGWAIAYNMTDVAIGLINAGVNVEAYEKSPTSSEFREKFDSTTFKYYLQVDSRIRALMMAAAQRNHEIAQALMDGGAKGNVYSRKYLFPVGIGAWYKDVKMMQIVLLGKAPEVQPRKCVIDLSSQRATLYENGVAVYSTAVSTGKSGYGTPPGEYVITDKHRHHTSTIYTGASMPYFQRFSCGAFGLHQGYVPGYPASHGCIRCPYEGAKTLFYKMKVGDYCVIQR